MPTVPLYMAIHHDKMNNVATIHEKKLCFFCHQNVNHEMLDKSQHCLGYVATVWKFKSVSRWRLGWWSRGQFCVPLMSMNALCRCHCCTGLPICTSLTLHKELSIAKWIRNMSSLKYLYTQIIINQKSSPLLIHAGFDWNLNSLS